MSGKEYKARTVEEALERALNEMMLTRDDIEYEVVTQPSKGIFGFGQRDAVVRVQKKVIEELKDIVADIRDERKEGSEQEERIELPKREVTAVKEEPAPVQEEVQPKTAEEPVKAEEVKEEKAPEAVEEKKTEADKEEERKAAVEVAEKKGREFLSKIFEEMNLEVQIDVSEKNHYLIFDLKGKNLGILIGRRGDTLDSLQFLLNLVINERNGVKVKGIIDIENYRAKREETLIGLSHKLASKARKTGQRVVLEPMNPQERRIIHMALQNDKRVTTYSEGEEPYRKVVIMPENAGKDSARK